MNLAKIRGKMAERGMTNTKMAAALGITPTTYSHKITGRRQFQADELIQLVKVLEITLDELGSIMQTGP